MAENDDERELRIELMKTQIDKTRLETERVRQAMRYGTGRVLVRVLLIAMGLLGVGIVIGRFVLFHG